MHDDSVIYLQKVKKRGTILVVCLLYFQYMLHEREKGVQDTNKEKSVKSAWKWCCCSLGKGWVDVSAHSSWPWILTKPWSWLWAGSSKDSFCPMVMKWLCEIHVLVYRGKPSKQGSRSLVSSQMRGSR